MNEHFQVLRRHTTTDVACFREAIFIIGYDGSVCLVNRLMQNLVMEFMASSLLVRRETNIFSVIRPLVTFFMGRDMYRESRLEVQSSGNKQNLTDNVTDHIFQCALCRVESVLK